MKNGIFLEDFGPKLNKNVQNDVSLNRFSLREMKLEKSGFLHLFKAFLRFLAKFKTKRSKKSFSGKFFDAFPEPP